MHGHGVPCMAAMRPDARAQDLAVSQPDRGAFRSNVCTSMADTPRGRRQSPGREEEQHSSSTMNKTRNLPLFSTVLSSSESFSPLTELGLIQAGSDHKVAYDIET
ncbi:hypothetical protein BDA96_07G143700 [Sorghum bicolor]|uniref:Uncharacterized protein n=2 Tax=Sorghum bicolor TaxID=4558 RepID=A0A921U9H3_SORBI|nr:hypothetical protein BDA96_07G143700 [Sorghum bicolor]OQU80486.1 hypothetical protein SORBI_3007G133850 [Sorghum bicolor]